MKRVFNWVKEHRVVAAIGLFCVIVVSIVFGYVMRRSSEAVYVEVPYKEFLRLAKEGAVDTVYYSKYKEQMKFTVFNEESKNMTLEERNQYEYPDEDIVVTAYPDYKAFRKDMLELGVVLRNVSKSSSSNFLHLASIFCIWVAFLILIVWANVGGFKDFSCKPVTDMPTTFKDIIGLDEVVNDVQFIVDLLKNPEDGKELGVKPPHGILFYGEPGCGKTLIAKAIAGEAGVPFFYASGAQFDEMLVGVGMRRVKNLFEAAKRAAPCVVFIDEIDAVGASRTNNFKRSNDQTINELLSQMDGFDSNDGIFVIAATNRLDILDSALVRPGRFDRHVAIKPPRDWKARKDLFSYYLSQYRVSDSVSVEILARQTPGFTGADVKTVCNEAALIAMQHEKKVIDTSCIEEAIDRKVFHGSKSAREQADKDREIVAYHEAGHAVASLVLGEPIARVSIVGSTSGVGGAVFGAEKDTNFQTENDILNRIMIAYAGCASEEIHFGKRTNGAVNDIEQATELLKDYVFRYGFRSDFGLINIDVLQKDSLIDSSYVIKQLSELSKIYYRKSMILLKENYERVEILARALLEKETLTAEEVQELFSPNANLQ